MGLFKSAKLMIAFYRDKNAKKLEKPFIWAARKPVVGLSNKDLGEQESFLLIEGEDGERDVEVRLHPDKIVLSRDDGDFWKGVVLDAGCIRVAAGGRIIEIAPDGAVKVRDDETPDVVSSVEADGSIYRLSEEATIFVSGDGSQASFRTDDRLSALTPEGVYSLPSNRRKAIDR